MPIPSTIDWLANRYGLNFKLYAYTDTEMQTLLMEIPFVNISSIELAGDRTWATGGRAHANKVGFNDPIQGTITMSTQIFTTQLLHLLVGNNLASTVETVDFVNSKNRVPKYYIMNGETAWQDPDGKIYDETLTLFKISPRTAYNISYSGEGDPTSMDIVFDLFENDNKQVLKVERGSSDEPIEQVGDTLYVNDTEAEQEGTEVLI